MPHMHIDIIDDEFSTKNTLKIKSVGPFNTVNKKKNSCANSSTFLSLQFLSLFRLSLLPLS